MENTKGPGDFSLPPRPPKRRRNQRTVYSVEQLAELEKFFHTKWYPSYDERETLAARLNLQEQQVQVWFKNRRAKESRLQGAARTEQSGPEAQASSQGPGVCASVPLPAPAAVEPSASSHLQIQRGTPQDAQGAVPDFPEIRTDLHFWSELDFTDLLSP